jgi:phycocyanin-associated, rod
MLGQSAFSRGLSNTAGNRIFVYEVTGLQQNEATAKCQYQVRTSGSTFMQVPLARMNQTMQRIANLGGQIVSIRPLSNTAEAKTEEHDQ